MVTVNLKDRIRTVLREHYGVFNTYLEQVYEDKLTENLFIESETNRNAWITYNQVILELKNNLQNGLKVKELQYKLTENKNPNESCIEVMEDIKTSSVELERLYYKIRNF
jgi:hypothetical protein